MTLRAWVAGGDRYVGLTAAAVLTCACGQTYDPAPAAQPTAVQPEPFETPECAATATTTPCSEGPSVESCWGTAGYDFLQAWVAWNNEDMEATLSVPRPGTICASGTLVPRVTYLVGVWLGFNLSRRDDAQTCILAPFDAQAEVVALQFDLDNVPPARLSLWAAAVLETQCDDSVTCTDGGEYTWLTPDRQELAPIQPGTIRVPLDELVGDDLLEPLRAHWISEFGLNLSATRAPLPFEFCVSNIQLLDSAGNVVLPAPQE